MDIPSTNHPQSNGTSETPITPTTVAQDVLEHLRTRKYVANSGSYIRFDNPQWISDFQGRKLTEVLNGGRDNLGECKVCAKGALFLSLVEKTDDNVVVNGQQVSGFGMVETLSDVFEETQLHLIEAAFELDASYYLDGFLPVEEDAAAENLGKRAEHFGAQYDDDHDRMVAIAQNIIDNGGRFTPPELPVGYSYFSEVEDDFVTIGETA